MEGLTPKCLYCGRFSKRVTGKVIYPHRPDLHNLTFYQCAPCDAYVGCHKGGDGRKPLGRLANADLRAAKSAAHRAFDPMWRDDSTFEKRHHAYAWLAGELGIGLGDCHIGMFDLEQCQKVVALCENYGRATPNELEGE